MAHMMTVTQIARALRCPYMQADKWLAKQGLSPDITINGTRGPSRLYLTSVVQPLIDARRAAIDAARAARAGTPTPKADAAAPAGIAEIDFAPLLARMDKLDASLVELKNQVDAILNAMTAP